MKLSVDSFKTRFQDRFLTTKTGKVCSLLANQLSVGAQGDLRICCNSSDGMIRTEKGSAHISTTSSFESLMQLPYMKSLRQSLQEGKEVPQCTRCWDMEKIEQKSFREIHNEMFPDAARRLILPSSESEFTLEYLNLDFGNKCNLACKMCTPASSSFLAKEQSLGAGHLTEQEVLFAKSRHAQAGERAWYEDESFWLLLENHLPTLKRIYLIGGEPFIIPEHKRLLEVVVASGYAENVALSYNSNFTVLPEGLIDLWKKFKKIELGASIDGTDEFYEYIRWPTPFSRVEANVRKVQELGIPHLHIVIHSTIQNLNLTNLASLLQRFETVPFFFLPLNKPDYLHAGNLPKEVIEKSLQSVREVVAASPRLRTSVGVIDLISYLEDVLLQHQLQPELQTRFLKTMSWYDQRRDQDLFKIHPYFEAWKGIRC